MRITGDSVVMPAKKRHKNKSFKVFKYCPCGSKVRLAKGLTTCYKCEDLACRPLDLYHRDRGRESQAARGHEERMAYYMVMVAWRLPLFAGLPEPCGPPPPPVRGDLEDLEDQEDQEGTVDVV